METLYTKNGLMFWSEEEIKTRQMLADFFLTNLTNTLKTANRGFEFVQIEAPILTPQELLSTQYTAEDVWTTWDDLRLRPETTMGSYAAARHLLNPYNDRKFKLPLVIWQHGKSFRREQDQPTKFMRLKEFYQLEFQILFSADTKNDYGAIVVPSVHQMIQTMLGPCHVEDSDRLPAYAEWTKDVVCDKTAMEVCSISRRTDFDVPVVEVAIGTDRCVYNFLQKPLQV